MTVDEADGKPLAGASVRIEGTALGAVSRADGVFEIRFKGRGKINLLVSMIGYKTQVTPVNLSNPLPVDGIVIRLHEQSLQTGEIVVSANKRVQAVQEVPISVSVLDSRSIAQRNIKSLDDALDYVPGVEVTKDNVSVRGSSGYSFGLGSRVALLLDGNPLLSGDTGEMKYDALPMFSVERIEVVKGAGSALYGSSALGGVINLITKEPSEKPEIKLRVFGGLYTKPRYEGWDYSDGLHQTLGFDAGWSGKIGSFGLLASAGAYKDEGFKYFDDSHKINFFSKLKYNPDDKLKLAATVNFAREDRANWVFWRSLDSATFPPTGTDIGDRVESNKLAFIVEATKIFDQGNFLVARGGVFGTFHKNRYQPDNIYYRASDAVSSNFELQMNTRFDESTILTFGTAATLNYCDAKMYAGQHSQAIGSLYAQAELSQIEDLILTAGTRLDYEKASESDPSLVLSPKIGLTYRLPFDATLRMSVGRGFRSPQIAERFATLPYSGFEVVPNTGLKPEMSWSYEVGYTMGFIIVGCPIQLDFAAFRNDMYDLIEPTFVSVGSAKITFRNITRASITGCELSIKTMVAGALGIEASVMFMDPLDLTLDEVLKYRSKYLLFSRIYLPFGAFEFQVDYRFKSKVTNVDKGLSIQIADYDARVDMHVVDARLICRLSKLVAFPVTATLNVKNLFDYYYTELVGNLGRTRVITLQIDTEF